MAGKVVHQGPAYWEEAVVFCQEANQLGRCPCLFLSLFFSWFAFVLVHVLQSTPGRFVRRGIGEGGLCERIQDASAGHGLELMTRACGLGRTFPVYHLAVSAATAVWRWRGGSIWRDWLHVRMQVDELRSEAI